MSSFLAVALAAGLATTPVPAAAKPGGLPVASNIDAWAQLTPKYPPLPVWARTLVGPLPKTTGAMLELDHLHRAENPLGPALSGKLRWVAADAMGCEYAKRYAVADMKRAKVPQADIDNFLEGVGTTPDDEKLLLKFARKLTRAAYSVTDEEFAAVLKAYGPERTCGAVHTLAYCNFHNRILLAVGAEVEEGGPIPPLAVPLDADRRKDVPSPPRPEWDDLKTAKQPKVPTRSVWADDETAADTTALLEAQKERPLRMPLPDAKRFAGMPPEVKRQTDSIVWMTVSMGYQPRLTAAWFAALRAYQSEAKLNRLASNSVFWVVTRGNECFY